MKHLKLLMTVLLLTSSFTANAGLIATNVGCSITRMPFWGCSQPSNTVGSGTEFQLGVSVIELSNALKLSVDISDTSVLISHASGSPFGLYGNELLTLTFDRDVAGISNFVASNVSVVSPGSVSFHANMLSIDLSKGAVWNVGSYLSFDIATTAADIVPVSVFEPVSVPEPAPLALLGLGLMGLALSRRKARA